MSEVVTPGAELLAAREHLTAVALHEERLAAEAKVTPLTVEQLEQMAQEFPQWGVFTGINEGEPTKRFTRTIPASAENTYQEMRLDDPEYFDARLKGIFNGKYGSGATSSEGSAFTVYAAATSPMITVEDYLCVAEAEKYLRDRGLVADMSAITQS